LRALVKVLPESAGPPLRHGAAMGDSPAGCRNSRRRRALTAWRAACGVGAVWPARLAPRTLSTSAVAPRGRRSTRSCATMWRRSMARLTMAPLRSGYPSTRRRSSKPISTAGCSAAGSRGSGARAAKRAGSSPNAQSFMGGRQSPRLAPWPHRRERKGDRRGPLAWGASRRDRRASAAQPEAA
jgi:hypothetical protein